MSSDYVHRTEVIASMPWSEPKGFRALCRNCNWRGPWHAHETAARRDGIEHALNAAVPTEPTGGQK